MGKGLTGMQKKFVEEHLKLRKSNQEQAAINAGYSPRSAASQASRLLTNVKVREYLKAKETAIAQELQQEFVFDALQARKVMYEILNDEEARDADRINVAKDFLDRAGFKPLERVEHKGSINISDRAEEIEKKLFADG